MPKPKKAPKLPPTVSNEGPFNKYDAVTLQGALDIFERSIGWDLLKEFIYYQAAVHGTMSNVLVQQTGRQAEACAAGAKAEALREIADQFLDKLKEKIHGSEGVVEDVRPTEQ